MSEELYNQHDYRELAEQYEELKKENAELTADKMHLMNLYLEISEYIYNVVANMKINDLERKCKALEADYVISNRELLVKQVETDRLQKKIEELEKYKNYYVETQACLIERNLELDALKKRMRWIPNGQQKYK